MRICTAILSALLLLFSCPVSRADVALLLHESTGKGVSELTSAGHSAVYVSNICMDGPTRLRLCGPGEEGSVIANYTNFGEDEPYEWNVAPLTVYLYGVEDPNQIPVYANAELLGLLQESYRRKYLSEVCPASPCETARTEAHWRDMVGSLFNRDIYGFRVKTTREQDMALIERFNSAPNVSHYNGFTRNCADFARWLVNFYFPNAAQRDVLNDFGMTSPKAIAKSFARYGERRPELMFSAEKFSQLPGPIKRSVDCRKGTEVGFRSKKWFVPMLMLRPHELAMFVVAYSLTGRFNPEHEYEKFPTARIAEFRLERSRLQKDRPASQTRAAELARLDEAETAERAEIVGNSRVWLAYRTKFNLILEDALREGVFRDKREMRAYFKDLARESTPELDQNGTPFLRVGESVVGLTRATLRAPNSDRRIASKLMLATVDATLRSTPKNRENLQQFEADWKIMTEFRNEPGRLDRAANGGATRDPRGQ